MKREREFHMTSSSNDERVYGCCSCGCEIKQGDEYRLEVEQKSDDYSVFLIGFYCKTCSEKMIKESQKGA